MRMAVYDRPQLNSTDNTANAQTNNEMGSLQNVIKRFQRKMGEDINEVKKEIYERINRDIGSMIRT